MLWSITMRLISNIRDFFSALLAFVTGVLAHLLQRGKKKEMAEYCHVCQVHEKPLQLGRYMIRTGPRAGLVLDPLPEISVFVCNRHHPDGCLDGAVWAKETQDFLKKLEVATQCVYLYDHNRQ